MTDICFFCDSMSAHDRYYGEIMCTSCYQKVLAIKKEQGWIDPSVRCKSCRKTFPDWRSYLLHWVMELTGSSNEKDVAGAVYIDQVINTAIEKSGSRQRK